MVLIIVLSILFALAALTASLPSTKPYSESDSEKLALVNAGDTAWIMVASALVLLMTPGLAIFYGKDDCK
jgi:Amt family ammonium transporter